MAKVKQQFYGCFLKLRPWDTKHSQTSLNWIDLYLELFLQLIIAWSLYWLLYILLSHVSRFITVIEFICQSQGLNKLGPSSLVYIVSFSDCQHRIWFSVSYLWVEDEVFRLAGIITYVFMYQRCRQCRIY